MIALGMKYTRMSGMWGKSVFDLTATDRPEIIRFFESIKDSIDRRALDDEELKKNCVTLPETQWEQAKALVYRFNMAASGQQTQAEKKEFLDQFAMEAVKGIIYGTDFIPLEMTIDQYVGAVMSARQEYGDSSLFSDRLMNIAGASNHLQQRILANQIDMFTALFNVPFEDVLGEINNQPEEEADVTATETAPA